MPDDVKFEIGKPYDIDYVIKELERAPEVQLGHIVINMSNEHKYHVNKMQLEDIAKKIKAAIVRGGKEYEKIGKKFVPLASITILSVIDPYTRYEKYSRFYSSLEDQIMIGIEESKKGSVAAATDVIINEARKMGTVIEDEKEFLDGMGIFFRRKGITTSSISGGKYILFEKIVPGAGVPRRVVVSGVSDIEAIKKEYEKYDEYTVFYDTLFNQIEQSMKESDKKEKAAPISAIIEESQKMGYASAGKENDFLRGMELYFKIRGMKVEKMDDKYLVIRKIG